MVIICVLFIEVSSIQGYPVASLHSRFTVVQSVCAAAQFPVSSRDTLQLISLPHKEPLYISGYL